MALGNFKFGPLNAASHVPSLLEILSDNGDHYPVDPILPPNPVHEFSPASSVIAALHFAPVFTDSVHHDLLL